MPKYVLDSSFLVSLAKIGRLYLLRQLSGSMICPQEVYWEVVEVGVNRGYADAFVIAQELFLSDLPLLKVASVNSRLKTKGISVADDCVLSLAFHEKATLLADDLRLQKKALATGIVVHNCPEFLMCYLGLDEYKSALEGLVKFNRLSSVAARLYLEVKKQWKEK